MTEAEIRADERERCARICDEVERQQENDNGAANTGGAAACAEAIRNAGVMASDMPAGSTCARCGVVEPQNHKPECPTGQAERDIKAAYCAKVCPACSATVPGDKCPDCGREGQEWHYETPPAGGVLGTPAPKRHALCGKCMTPSICAEDGPGCAPVGVREGRNG